VVDFDRGFGRFESFCLFKSTRWVFSFDWSFFVFISSKHKVALAKICPIILSFLLGFGDLAKFMLDKVLSD